MPPLSSPSDVLLDFQRRRALSAMASGVVRSAAVDEPDAGGTGPTYTDQIQNKLIEVRNVLERYTTIGAYDQAAVNTATAAIEQWRAQNASVWSSIVNRILPPEASVSEAEALNLPADLLRAYVESLFLSAEQGFGLYTSGTWQRLVDGGDFQLAYVRDDANARIQVLDTILSLEAAGVLRSAYGAPGAGTSGFGAPIPWVPIVIVVGVVLAIAALGLVINSVKQTETNNKIREAMCAKFLETGERQYNAGCSTPPDTELVSIAKYGIGAGAAVLLIYLLAGKLPSLVKEFQS